MFKVSEEEPDEGFCEELESLMLEGRLIEVTVDELPQLSHFKHTLEQYKKNRLAVPHKVSHLSV